MAYALYYHPLSSYCWKALIALYEADIPFEKQLVDLGDQSQREAFLRLAPLGKFPALRDSNETLTIVESSIIIEHLAQREPRAASLLPSQPEAALPVRARDRFFDWYVMEPMGKIVGDKLRPQGERDSRGVQEAHARLETAYSMLEHYLGATVWAAGASFSLADCAAAPSLFYANKVHPLGERAAHTRAYLRRIEQRPSFARVLREAQPYFALFPG